jgi:uncharacterized protein YqhQ
MRLMNLRKLSTVLSLLPLITLRLFAQPKKKVGGQAIIEGVMIRGRTSVVTAVRKPGGDIAVDARPLPSASSSRLRRIPFVRGVVILLESMVLGIQTLQYSASVSMEEEEEQLSSKALWGMIALGAVLVVALFFIAPLFLTNLADKYLIGKNSPWFYIIEGVIRLALFIGYLKLISLMPDIKRVFTYHGAEHKTVNAYEAGVPMEVAAIKTHSTAHVRCGTSFLFLVLVVAIVVFSLVGRQVLWLMVLYRIVLIPVIMGIGYEVIYFGARHTGNWFVKIILAPGLWLQALTTGEPDDRQLEVAIAAMNKAVEIDRAEEAAAPVAV